LRRCRTRRGLKDGQRHRRVHRVVSEPLKVGVSVLPAHNVVASMQILDIEGHISVRGRWRQLSRFHLGSSQLLKVVTPCWLVAHVAGRHP
jgi:hypothetical protein